MSVNPPADDPVDPLTPLDPLSPLSPVGPAVDIELIREKWGWFLGLGIVQILVGTAAIVMAVVATFASIMLLGLLALIAGGVQLASAVWSRGWNGALHHILIGVIYLAFGMTVISFPIPMVKVMTLVLGLLFLVGGTFRIGLALTTRFHHWGWVVLSGVVTLLLGGMILSGFPGTSFWVIGTFVGIELLFTGWTWVVLALGLRSVGRSTQPVVA